MDVVEKLRKLGLTKREAEVYLTIALRGSATVKDLLESLDVHQPQLYNILSSLVRKGFVRVSMERPKVYQANSIESLIESYKVRLDKLKHEISESIEILRRGSESSNYPAYISIIHGLGAIETEIIEALSTAREEVCAALPLSVFKNVIPYFIAILERGVNLYLLVYPEMRGDDISRLKSFKNQVRVRVSKLGNFLFVVSDLLLAVYARRRFFSMYKPPVPSNEIYGYVIQEKDMIWRLLTLYVRTWRNARELVSRESVQTAYPRSFLAFDLALAELEELLSRGFTPYVEVEAIDVRLGKPVRLEGEVLGVNITDEVRNFVIKVNDYTYTVGGFDAEIEDYESKRLTIKRIEKRRKTHRLG